MKPYFQSEHVQIYHGDVREVLPQIEDESVHCVVTSPPYWGLRDYGTGSWEGGSAECDHRMNGERRQLPHGDGRVNDCYANERVLIAGAGAAFKEACGKCGAIRQDRQLGLESTPDLYISEMTAVFREVRRVLRSDGTLWLNMGDSYAGSWGAQSKREGEGCQAIDIERMPTVNLARNAKSIGLKPKDLCGIPWMLAFALRADGWYLRQDIIWSKPNPMPESVSDRCTKAHEYIFLLSKSERYYYDQEAIKEESFSGDARKPYAPGQVDNRGNGHDRGGGKPRTAGNKSHKYVTEYSSSDSELHRTKAGLLDVADKPWEKRNKRSVWEVTTQPFPEAHFATFPPDLIKPCILAGCPAGGTVLDPFMGSGTTGLVAAANNCKCIGIELNAEYIEIAQRRLSQEVFNFSGQG